MRTRYFLRAHRFDLPARRLAEGLTSATGCAPVVICDDRKGAVETGPFPRVPITPQTLSRLGFGPLPDNWGWFCGDLWHHVAAEVAPAAEFLCLLDADVFLGAEAAAILVEAFEVEAADAIAADLGPHPQPPRFSRGLADLGLDPHWGCLFPVTRVRAGLLPVMADLRRRALRAGIAINDEAVLAGAVAQTGASHRDLRSVAGLFPNATFDTNPPHLFEAADGAGRGALHPVVTLGTVLDRIASGERAYGAHRLRAVLREADTGQRAAIEEALARHGPVAGDVVDTAPQDRRRLARLAEAVGLDHPLQVLDVGANPIEGEVSYRGLLDLGLAHVTGFEPQPEALAALNARKSARETYLPDALGDGADHDLHLFRQSGFTSLFPADPTSAAYLGLQGAMTETGSLRVPTRALDDLAAVPPPDLLKIDVQGSEAMILRHGRARLSGVLVVQTEVRFFPLYAGEPRPAELATELHGLGLEFYGFDFVKRTAPESRYKRRLRRRAFTQAIDGDAFFVRDLRRVASFTDAALARLTVLSDAVMRAHDLTLFCLDHLQARGRIGAREVDDYIALLPEGLRRD